MSEGNSDLCVVVYGTPWDGMAIHGPFTHDAAVEAAAGAIDDSEPYEIVTLHEPDGRCGTLAMLMHHLSDVNDQAAGDSNDEHIEALNNALDAALELLGIQRPEPEEES
jgi:hypothetical protein